MHNGAKKQIVRRQSETKPVASIGCLTGMESCWMRRFFGLNLHPLLNHERDEAVSGNGRFFYNITL
jgi:hypothetical protein